jgi:hypothetical protein
MKIPVIVTRYAAVTAVVLCTGFGLVGVSQSLLSVPQLNQYGVPQAIDVIVDRAGNSAAFLGLPIYRWAAKVNVSLIRALPTPVRNVVLYGFDPAPQPFSVSSSSLPPLSVGDEPSS